PRCCSPPPPPSPPAAKTRRGRGPRAGADRRRVQREGRRAMMMTTRKRASKRRGHLGNLFLCRSARHAEAVHWVCRQGTAQAEATTYHTTRYDSAVPQNICKKASVQARLGECTCETVGK
ncbi:unnamed protein product, partial [Prorocentrum cordatum]